MNTFVIHEDLLAELQAELFVDDGKEKVAFLLCGSRFSNTQRKLIAHRVFTLPDTAYVLRSKNRATWITSALDDVINQAMKQHLHIMKVHSHPDGSRFFSGLDDESDAEVFRSLHELLGEFHLGASMVLTPNGVPLVRLIEQDLTFARLDRLMIVGDNIEIHGQNSDAEVPVHAQRHAQLFGSATTNALRSISTAVVGASGTGSITIEQLARYGIGKLVIIDPEKIEDVNLNRIVNSTKADIGRLKVDVMAESVTKMELGTVVEAWPVDLAASPEAVLAVANCDVIFGCVDSHEARYLLNKIACFYCLPYIDMGVCIVADGIGNVDRVETGVHYFSPGKSSHLKRGSISLENVRAEGMKRTNREEYDKQRLMEREDGQKYLTGADEEETRPAVITVNMAASCMAVMEFLARLHPFRAEASDNYARTAYSFVNMDLLCQAESEFDASMEGQKNLGNGDVTPLLHIPSLSKR